MTPRRRGSWDDEDTQAEKSMLHELSSRVHDQLLHERHAAQVSRTRTRTRTHMLYKFVHIRISVIK